LSFECSTSDTFLAPIENRHFTILTCSILPCNRHVTVQDAALSGEDQGDASLQLFDLANSTFKECKATASLSHLDTTIDLFSRSAAHTSSHSGGFTQRSCTSTTYEVQHNRPLSRSPSPCSPDRLVCMKDTITDLMWVLIWCL
jgi:hypothetical protein